MKRPAQIALFAILAVLASSAVFARPVQALAAGSFGEVEVLGEAQNIGLATLGYSDRSWTTVGSLVGQAIALVPKTSVGMKDETTPEEKKSDLAANIAESEAVVKEIFVKSQFLASEVSLLELKWHEASDSGVLDLTQGILENLGGENDLSTSDTLYSRALFLEETWQLETAQATEGQVLAIRENLHLLQSEVEASGLTPQAYEKLSLVSKQFGELEALVGAPGDLTSETLFGAISNLKSTKLNLGDFTTQINTFWS